VIKYLVNLKPTKDISIYDADILNVGNPLYTVNHVDHIDFNIIKLRSNKVVVKTHKTIYTDLGGFKFDRTTPMCNFIFNETKLDNINCEKMDGSIYYNIKAVYSPLDIHITQELCNMMINFKGGRKRRVLKGGNIFLDVFIDFIYKNIISRIQDIRSDILEIKLLYDASVNINIIMFIDFIEYSSIILVLENPENLMKSSVNMDEIINIIKNL